MMSPELRSAPLGLLFTDATGQVVFADPSFLRMLNYREAGVVAGEPLHRALGLDQKLAKQLLEDLRKTGQVRDRRLDLQTANGGTVLVAFTGVANYDDSGSFIGADLTVRDVKRDTAEVPAIGRGDVIKTRVQQILSETGQEDAAYLRSYFTTQMEALYVLMGRLVGLWVHNNLDKMINSAATLNGWSVQFNHGALGKEVANPDGRVYKALLAEASNYAVSMIGQRVVARELRMVDEYMDERTRKVAADAGLRDLLNR
jgi:hypothetical protein